MTKAMVAWDDSYLIGIDDLDAEHRQFVAMLDDIFRRASSGAPMTALAEPLADFIHLFSRHAAKEAALLRRLGEPAGVTHRGDHIAGHARFLDAAHALREHCAAGTATPAEIDRLGVLLTLFELIEADYEMVGHLKREGLLGP